MYDIFVNIKPQTESGKIFYYHDPEIYKSILYITSSVSRFNISSINIRGGHAIIAFDKNRILQSTECLYPRVAWEKSQTLFIPKPELFGDIELAAVKTELGILIRPDSTSKRMGEWFFGYQDDDTEVKILTDDTYSIAWIMLGKHGGSGDWVGLSDQCSALLKNNKLSGFSVKLADAPPRAFRKTDSHALVH
jgi:hypothetical protein